ncbi:tetratricopeptide repeat protein [Myxococcaceae bacterium JPH2]|nr:tetratricopeptide repeat protein [Myxococcaceae bacterium JPH2]
MSPRSRTAPPRRAPSSREDSLTRALRNALLPACFAALGITAWGDVPGALASRFHHAPTAPSEATPVLLSTPEAPREVVAAAPLASTPDLPVAPVPVPDADGLGLAHSHGRKVDHLGRSRVLSELGDLSGALTECRRALHDEPLDSDALAELARLARLAGQTELALQAYTRLGRLEASSTGPLLQQARLLLSLGRAADAVHAGEEALLRDPEEPEVYQVLGLAHLSAGELALAILRFQQAVHLDPEHGYALNNLGFAYLRAGENQKAMEVLAQAAALLPHVAYVHNNLGVACERLGRTEEARAAYATATRLSPRYVQARVNAERMKRLAHADPPLALTPELPAP